MKPFKITRLLIISCVVLIVASIGIFKTLAVKGSNQIINKQKTSNNTDITNNSSNIKTKSSNILLANKDTPLGRDFVPENLVTTTVPSNKEIEIDKTANKKLTELFKAAKKEGLDLLLVSGYRDYATQNDIFNEGVANDGLEHTTKYIAKPGESEHQTGLAVDIVSYSYMSLDDGFENSPTGKWLAANAYKFGFILRYPKDKENVTKYNYEPWHFRYVGDDIAKEIKDSGLTLEEYISKKG